MLLLILDVVTDIINDSESPVNNAYSRMKTTTKHFADSKPAKPVEELDIMKDVQYDLDILVSADALQADDDLLVSTITEIALEQCNPSWIQSVEFVVSVIGNRIPLTPTDADKDLGYILETYSLLPPAVKEVVDNIFKSRLISTAADTKEGEVTLPKLGWQTIARWAFCIFLDINSRDAPLNHLQFDISFMQKWISGMPGLDIRKLSYSTANMKMSGLNIAFLAGCWQMTTKGNDLQWIAWDHFTTEHRWVAGLLQHHSVSFKHGSDGLQSHIVEEAARTLTSLLDKHQSEDVSPDSIAYLMGLVVGVYSVAGTTAYDGTRKDTPLRLHFQHLLQQSSRENNASTGQAQSTEARENSLVHLCHGLNVAAFCQIITAVCIANYSDDRRCKHVRQYSRSLIID